MNAIGKMVDFQNIYEQMLKDLENQDYAHISYLSGVAIRKIFDFEPYRRLNVAEIMAEKDHDVFE